MTRGLLQILEWLFFNFVQDDWIQTYSGVKFYFKNPKSEDILLEDIAHVLSMIPRYGGHSKRFLSVAEHSVHMSRQFDDKQLALAALFHDAAETYIGDVVTPLKRMLPFYKIVEERILGAIALRFGFAWNKNVRSTVKEIDKRMFVTEVLQLAKFECLSKWYGNYSPLDVTCQFWDHESAKTRFIERFRELVQ